MRAFQVREGDPGSEDPVQLENLRHVALAEERGPSRIDPQREESGGRLESQRSVAPSRSAPWVWLRMQYGHCVVCATTTLQLT